MTEHGSYLRDILPCSDRCHETITTDGALFIPKGYILCSDRCYETITTDGAWFISKGYITML